MAVDDLVPILSTLKFNHDDPAIPEPGSTDEMNF
jgi:hypothetical protein